MGLDNDGPKGTPPSARKCTRLTGIPKPHPKGIRALSQMLGVFAELEGEMIVTRVNACIARAKAHGTKTGRAIGRLG